MTRIAWTIGFVLLLAAAARGQPPERPVEPPVEPPVEIPPVERTPFSAGGILEARPAVVWFDTGAALYRLQPPPDARSARAGSIDARIELDAGYRRGWFSAHTRTVVEGGYARSDWSSDATAYEAYVSLKPAPSLTVDAGKKTFKWGKGYLWTPSAFLDRPKSPEDPALAREGFLGLSADYIRTFGGPLQTLSLTPVLLPVYGTLNAGFGERGHLNAAGRLYLLLYDTDVDVMVLAGGSRPGRFGFAVSRNLRSNLELHGEWTRVPHAVVTTLGPAATIERRERPATALVVGLRYLTAGNTTFVADYYRNGNGYTSGEIEAFFGLVDRAHDLFTAAGDDGLLTLARRAGEAGYSQITPGRHYVYGRVTQPDALGVLYLTLGASAIVNADDGSHALLPEVQYRATGNLELRWLANIQRGGRWTEFGEKQADLRIELRVRYYF